MTATEAKELTERSWEKRLKKALAEIQFNASQGGTVCLLCGGATANLEAALQQLGFQTERHPSTDTIRVTWK
jgi:hypothetical protein